MNGFNSERILAAVLWAASIPLMCLTRRGLRGIPLPGLGAGRLRPATVVPLSISQGVAPPEALERWRAVVRRGGFRHE